MTYIKEKNILTIILKLLKVKYTKLYSESLFDEHPYKDNLFGLSKMLSKYGIKCTGLKLDAKIEAIHSLNVPFLSYYNNQFIVVYKIEKNKIFYIQNRKKDEEYFNDFI